MEIEQKKTKQKQLTSKLKFINEDEKESQNDFKEEQNDLDPEDEEEDDMGKDISENPRADYKYQNSESIGNEWMPEV